MPVHIDTSPLYPDISDEDREHPRFPEYNRYRYEMVSHLTEAKNFQDWLRQAELYEELDKWSAHPKYPEFAAWMIENQGGARRCAAGAFPENFKYWLDGGRW